MADDPNSSSLTGVRTDPDGGGGGGGAVTIANGSDASQGNTTDAESASGDGTVIAILKRLRTLLAGGLPAALGSGGGVKVDGSGTALPVSGTVTATITDGSGPVTVDGTVTANAGTGPFPVSDNAGSLTVDSPQLPAALAAGGGIKVEGVAGGVAQPVSLAANQSVNQAQVAGTTTDTNSGNKSAGTQRVVLATDQPTNTNPLTFQPATYGTIATGELQGATSATQNPNVSARLVRFKAAAANAGKVYLGVSGVTKVDGTTDTTSGLQLAAGDDTGWIPIANVNLTYRICDNAGDALTYMALV